MLYILSTYSHPAAISFSEIGEYEDRQVILRGVVSDHSVTVYDSQILTLRDINGSDAELMVFVEMVTDVEYGDIIEAIGSVQKYQDSWELVVSHPKNIKIVSSWDNNSSPLWQLAEQPEKYVGLNVRTNGFIDRIYESFYYLIDASGRYSLVVYCMPENHHNLSEGTSCSVDGRFLYDSENFRYCIDQRN
jgi:hypothetical protein